MSAIWGIISKKENTELIGKNMTEAMKNYKIDRFDDVSAEGIYMACGHQYITKESHFDVSPIYDKSRGVFYTADAFLTNRNYIIDMLPKGDYSKIGDAELIYRLYETIGETFINEIRGSFAIAIYNQKSDELKLYADPMARRYLAYYADDSKVCFGTVYTPIKVCVGDDLRLNEEGIAQYYMDCLSVSFRTPGTTVYENIYHVNCAECVTINCMANKKSTSVYYVVGKGIKTLKLKTDDDYKDAFISAYRNAVVSMLRHDDGEEIGIQLSGGLDSSSVAALAADELAKSGKNLYGFTIVPTKDYPAVNCVDYIENERPTVEAQKIKHPNLVTSFINGDEGCAFTNLKEYQKLFECPIKPAMNIDNLCNLYKTARKMNCRLILGGANGNSSISYGDISYYVTEKLRRLQLIKAYKEIKAYCKLNNRSRKGFAKEYLKGRLDDITSKSGMGRFCLLNDTVISKYNIEALAKERGKAKGSYYSQTKQQRYNYIYNTTMFQHIGFFETYASLLFGIYDVDPTITVELVEFCLSLPIECYVKNGRERRTIRDYMDEELPKCVTSERYGRGIQVADAEFRVQREWPKIKDDVQAAFENDILSHYFDCEKVSIIEGKVKTGNMDRDLLIKSLACYSLSYFLQSLTNA